MSFIAIDAKADVTGSKKGKLTPAQHAQLNAWCLASKTGILDWGDKCVSTAESYSVSNDKATIVLKRGYIVICGRLVECEANTQVSVSAPAFESVSGKIILRYNLNNSGNDEFVVTTTTSELRQDDLNDNPLTGVYEFELYSYTATPTTVTLMRTNTDYIPDIGGKLQPLQGYNTGKGTIEQRLTDLGFKTGNATNLTNVHSVTLKKLGKFVICSFTYTKSIFSFDIPKDFAPYENFNIIGASSNGDIRILVGSNESNAFIRSPYGVLDSVNYHMQIGWSTDGQYPI